MKNNVTRRSFLKAGALAAAAWPVLGQQGFAAANEKVNLLAVGVGGKGRSDLLSIAASPFTNVVALCDIDESEKFLGGASMKFPQAKKFTDWRKALELKNIDAVQVSTPDHMHAPIALAAMALGKHVYCQKPLSHTVQESRLMKEAAKKAKVVTQMGNQIQSHNAYRTATRLVHDGVIGKVKEVHSWQSGNPSWRKWKDRPEGSAPVPSTIHWDNWIGVAQPRPYLVDVYHAFNWRNWMEFGTGQLGDFACHILDPVFTSLLLTAPTHIEAESPAMNGEVWNDRCLVKYVFPSTQYTAGDTINVTWYDGVGHKPAADKVGLPADATLPAAGSILIGEKGSLVIPHVAAPQLYPKEKFVEFKFPEIAPRDHYTSWIDACRGEDKATSNFDYSGPLTETVLLGSIATQLPGEKLIWNAADLKFKNSEAATKLLSKPYRKGWELTKV